MAKLTSVIFKPALIAPSEKTAKFTLGGLFTVTTGTPALCSTANEAEGLVAVSLAAKALAVAMMPLAATTGICGAGAGDPLSPPPPQPVITASTEQTMLH